MSQVDGKEAKVGSSMHGTTFKLTLSNWETWMVFTSESVTWKLTSKDEVQVRRARIVLGGTDACTVGVARGGGPSAVGAWALSRQWGVYPWYSSTRRAYV